jgi:hypothetical protein
MFDFDKLKQKVACGEYLNARAKAAYFTLRILKKIVLSRLSGLQVQTVSH